MSSLKKFGKKIAKNIGISTNSGGSKSKSGSASAPKRRRPAPSKTPSVASTEEPTEDLLNRLDQALDPNLFTTEGTAAVDEQNPAHDEADDEEEEDDDDEQPMQSPDARSQHTVESQLPTQIGGGMEGGGRPVSHVWSYFEKILIQPARPRDGGVNAFNCTCKLCRDNNVTTIYVYKTGGGTGTMARHLAQRHGVTKQTLSSTSTSRQTQLHGFAGSMPGGGMPFTYSHDRMVQEFAKFVVLDELPFSHGESQHLEYFNRVALQPQYRSVPRNTTKRKAFLQFAEQRGKLFNEFAALDTRISLTADTWTSPIGDPFICVTAHWIDDEWFLQKRIIAFQGMHDRHNGFNIKTRIVEVCNSWGITNKIFAISLDNATANTKAVEYFISDHEFPKIVEGKLFHNRCCAHVLNLSAQEGIAALSPLIEPLREIARWIKFRRDVKEEYKELCAQKGVYPKKLKGDCATRWNSTYDLVNPVVQYQQILSIIYNKRVHPDHIITDYQWSVCSKLCDVLASYSIATNIFSLVYEPNINQVILQAVNIVHAISEGMQTPELSGILQGMLTKWFKYMGDIPHIYGLAILFDPCLRKDGLENAITFYYGVNNIEYDVYSYVQSCLCLLDELYGHYSAMYCPDQPPPSEPTFAKRFNPALANILFKNKGKQPASSSQTTHTEIDDYFSAVFEGIDGEFNIIDFWKVRHNKFPILARIARDILAIPASTIASEAAFSSGKRVIDDRRTSLSAHSVEMCVCKRDWELADKREQHLRDLQYRLDSPDSGSSAAVSDQSTDSG